jgi:hypothetical protein
LHIDIAPHGDNIDTDGHGGHKRKDMDMDRFEKYEDAANYLTFMGFKRIKDTWYDPDVTHLNQNEYSVPDYYPVHTTDDEYVIMKHKNIYESSKCDGGPIIDSIVHLYKDKDGIHEEESCDVYEINMTLG